MAERGKMLTLNNTVVFGQHDSKTLEQLRDVASRAERAALLADGHFGYVMPVGGVAAYRNKVSVAGVGFDIACGNAAIRTDLTPDALGGLEGLADEIAASISFGLGRKNTSEDAPVDHPLFGSEAWEAVPPSHRDSLKERARAQLGTVGAGNHYVDIFADEEGRVWVAVHFGSRGLGHALASNFMALAQNEPWGVRVKETEALLSLGDELGQAYWATMNLAGEYAYAGRGWVARKVVALMGARELELVHNHHNFAWKEHHVVDGEREEVVVVRKGATPAHPGQKGFVGGSMGDDAVILKGSSHPSPEASAAMFSTVHGAGRVMSRTEAAGKWDWKLKRRKTAGKISPEMMQSWLREKNVILRGGGLDEAPQAYRRLPDVLRAQGGTVEVLHTLKPLIVVMAGEAEFDPYKD